MFNGVVFPLTHVIQAPLSAPKAIFHAGSSAWKYSSGWKKVLIVKALTIRKARRNPKTRIHCELTGTFASLCGFRETLFEAIFPKEGYMY